MKTLSSCDDVNGKNDDNDTGDDSGDDGGDDGGDDCVGEGDDFSVLPSNGAQLYPVVEMEVKAEAALEFCFLSPVIIS